MRKDIIPIVLMLAMLLSSFCCGEPITASAMAGAVHLPVSAAGETAARADGEGLLHCLRHIASWQEATAGSSLRMAQFAAELAEWTAANPGGWKSVEAELRTFIRGLSDCERADLLRHLQFLHGFCSSVSSRQFREILIDAGIAEAPSAAMPGCLTGILEEIADAVPSLSIQNLPEKMNIHRGWRCRPEKSLL